MSVTTPNLTLTLYDSTTDQVVTFATFRAVWGGTATTSNFYRIDTWAGTVNSAITTLQNQRGAIPVSASFISANYYEATVASITSYVTGMTILLKLDTTSSGTVTLNINSLGTKSVTKVNSSGSIINIAGGELSEERLYLFEYDGTQWVWVNATSSDQIVVIGGTSGNVLTVSSNGSIEGTTTKSSLISSTINSSTEKTTIADNDEFGIADSAASYILKKIKYISLKLSIYLGIKPQDGVMFNGKIVPSVSSNNITLAIKTFSGADPSSSDPVYITFNNDVKVITSALSVTKNAGTNWFNSGSLELRTKEIDYFVYLGYNSTDGIVIGFSRIPYATTYSDFSTTNTNSRYAAISTITNATAEDPYFVVGRFAATLSAGSAYNWSVPTFTPSNLIQRKIDYTRTLQWSPQPSRITTNYTNLPTIDTAEYTINGKFCDIFEKHTQNATPGGSGNQRITLPIDNTNIPQVGFGTNNAVATSQIIFLTSDTATYFKYDGTADVVGSNSYTIQTSILL